MRRDRIGLQLFTVRGHAAEDMEGTLRRVAAIGYRAVELAGYGDSTPARIRTVLDELGMVAVAAHVPFHDWEDRRRRVLDDLHALGARYGVVPSVPSARRAHAGAVADLADLLNVWGRACSDEGLRLAYHNHQHEHASLGEATVWEMLAAETDPELVDFELDLYWAAYAGADPAGLLRTHPDRVTLLHAKDMAPGVDRRDAPVGDGVLPWDEIEAVGGPDRWWIVEQDQPCDPFEAARRGFFALLNRSEARKRD